MLETHEDWIGTHRTDLLLHTAQKLLPKKEWRRRSRLLACALLRRFFGETLEDSEVMLCLRTAKEFADSHCTSSQRDAVRLRLAPPRRLWRHLASEDAVRAELWRAALLLVRQGESTAACQQLMSQAMFRQRDAGRDGWADAIEVIRDIVRPPFAPQWGPADSPSILAWARAIYDERRFDELPVLGDAVEDWGVTTDFFLTNSAEVPSTFVDVGHWMPSSE